SRSAILFGDTYPLARRYRKAIAWLRRSHPIHASVLSCLPPDMELPSWGRPRLARVRSHEHNQTPCCKVVRTAWPSRRSVEPDPELEPLSRRLMPSNY